MSEPVRPPRRQFDFAPAPPSKRGEPTRPKPRFPLLPWQVKFCAFLADQAAPPIAAQEQAASTLAGTPVTYGQLKTLKKRADFRDLLGKMRSGGVEAARQLLISDLPLFMQLHTWGAERSKQKDDTRGLAQYTVPALDRVLPRRESLDIAAFNKTIVLTVSEKQQLLENTEPLELTVEALPPVSADPRDSPIQEPPIALPAGALTFADMARIRRETPPREPVE